MIFSIYSSKAGWYGQSQLQSYIPIEQPGAIEQLQASKLPWQSPLAHPEHNSM